MHVSLHQQRAESLCDVPRVNQTGESTKPPAQEFVNFPNHACVAGHVAAEMVALPCAKPQGDGIFKRALMSAWHWFKLSSTNPLEKYTGAMKKSASAPCVTCVSSLLKEQAVSSVGYAAPRDLCCTTYVFHYHSFSNISSGLVASQSAWEGGLGPPEIDLFLHPNCLLNIIDHQSCHREEGKKELLQVPQKREPSLKSYLSKESLS